MNFSKLNPDGIPLWWLIYTGQKFKTRRPPACLHCGKKWWLHTCYAEHYVCPITAKSVKSYEKIYEPDLSRWQPKEIPVHEIVPTMRRGVSTVITKRTDIIYKELAICPGRGRAAVCATCGGWKEMHFPFVKEREEYLPAMVRHNEFKQVKVTATTKITQNVAQGIAIEICHNYQPLRLKVVEVEMESEWLAREEQELSDIYMDVAPRSELQVNIHKGLEYVLQKEARAEGFQTWEQLQDALYGKGGYPKGTPMAVIEFERRQP